MTVSLPSLSTLWTLAKKIDGLLELEERQSKSLADLAVRLTTIERRMDRLEDREERMVEKAENAARSAATIAATASLADIAHRVGVLEGRTETVAKKRTRRIKGPS